MTDSARPALARLADRLGVFASYHDIAGTYRPTSDATREALCSAMGYACASEAEAEARLAELAAHEAEHWLDPVAVLREEPGAPLRLRLRAPDGEAQLELARESGGVTRSAVTVSGGQLALPADLGPGVHELQLEFPERKASQLLIVAPRTAWRADEALGEDRALGVWTNLYTLRSRVNWGFGDFSDLARLAEWLAPLGVDFVAVNPLHALANRGDAIAPYSPVSRVFMNPLYLDVEAVPELAHAERARAMAAQQPLARLRGARELDHPAILAAKTAVLRELWRAFVAGERAGETARGRAHARARQELGPELADFAAFETLQAELREPDWRRWPAELRDPRSPEVREFAAAHAEEIDFRSWLQAEAELQLAFVAGAARGARMRIGVCKDLAIGSAPDSADTWLWRGLFAQGVSLGAPPDAYAASGQDWGLPPLVPHRLRADGYRFLRQLLRAAFRSSGALRIDHVMGLQRQFWIPEGRPGSEGTYVAQPANDLFGVLALESRRARSLVVGEDLGTVPVELGPELESWGVLSMRVVCFERDGAAFRPSAGYPRRALSVVVTHDLPPIAGWLEGADLRLRAQVGSLPPDELEGALAARSADREGLASKLREEGELGEASDVDAISRAAQRFLARTPSRLVGLALDDLAGEREPLNLPGIPVAVHRSWSRRMARELEDLAADPELETLLQDAAARTRDRRGEPEGSPA
ncbi:MAG TPA: 4-alpha-glucanotransferase [Myxococcota bacterium]|nr:4-alpha-glucanotransferase [Myxococcota bacterium]